MKKRRIPLLAFVIGGVAVGAVVAASAWLWSSVRDQPHASLVAAIAPPTSTFSAGSIAIHDPYAFETVGRHATAAVYFRIHNDGQRGDRLVSVTSKASARAQIHTSTVHDGVARMRPIVDGTSIDARDTLVLAPAGVHVMLIGLARPLRAGDKVPITLTFEHAGDVDIAVRVRRRAGVDVPRTTNHNHSHGSGKP